MGQRFFFGRHLHFASPSRATVASVALFALVCSCSAFGSEIHDAVRNGDAEKVRALLKDNPALVCSKDDKGLTPLHQAAPYGHADMAALLLDSEACVNATAIDGTTPLHAAATHGHSDIAELLLTNKAQVNTRKNGGLTPLHLASLLDHRDVAVLLLDNQADVNSKSGAGVSDENGPAIHVLSVLLGAGLTIDHTRSYGGGATPLHLAALSGHKDLAEILLAHILPTLEPPSYGRHGRGSLSARLGSKIEILVKEEHHASINQLRTTPGHSAFRVPARPPSRAG